MTTSPTLSPLQPNRWLNLGRIAWVVVAVITLLLFVMGLPQRYIELATAAQANRALLDVRITAGSFALYFTALSLAIGLMHFVTALIIFWRRSHEKMALLVVLALVTNGATAPLSSLYALAAQHPIWNVLVNAINYLGLVSSIVLLLTFPDGNFVPRWTRPVAWIWSALNVPAVFFPTSPLSFTMWPGWLAFLVLLAVAGIGAYAQLYRFTRVSNPVERQQTKWVAVGLVAAALRPFGYLLPFGFVPLLEAPNLPNFLYQLVGASFFTFSLFLQWAGFTVLAVIMMIFPVSFAICLFRYHLWEFEIIIRRTVIYTLLSALGFGVYLLAVGLTSTLFNTQRDFIIPLLALAVVAFLARPLYRQLETTLNRILPLKNDPPPDDLD